MRLSGRPVELEQTLPYPVVVIRGVLSGARTGIGAAELFGAPPSELALLLPQEAVLLDPSAVAKRQREFVGGRLCAHRALELAGFERSPVLRGPGREPVWPPGVVGSITHCTGYAAAVAAPMDEYSSLGIDAEPHVALPASVFEAVADSFESSVVAQACLACPGIHMDLVLFCAKEAIFKYWFQHTRERLRFCDARVEELSPSGGVRAMVETSSSPLATVTGRWAAHGGLVLVAVDGHKVR